MRVLFHIPLTAIGGAEIHVRTLIQNASPWVEPLVTYERIEVKAFAESLGVPAYQAPGPSMLAKTINRLRPDVIHFFHSPSMGRALNRLVYKPKVYEVIHNSVPFHGDTASYGKDGLDAVICVSHDALRRFEQLGDRVPAFVIPNGIDRTLFCPGDRHPADRETGSTVLAGFMGRLERGDGKGIPTLLDLAEKFKGRLQLELVGYDEGNHYRDMVAALGLDNVKVLNPTSTPWEYYRRWDLYLSASPAEGFGLSIAEALACGTPTIALNCGGICEYLQNGVHAILPLTPEAMVWAVKSFIEAFPLGGLPTNPRGAKFCAQEMTRQYEALWESAAGAKRADEPIDAPPPVSALTGGVLAVTPEDWYGVRRALAPISDVCTSPEKAPRMIRILKPRVVVFGCYQDSWLDVLKTARSIGAKTVLTWHASYILNEFDHINRVWMSQALAAAKAGLFDYVATPHEGLAKTWTKFGIKTDFLPNAILATLNPRPKFEGTHIGILGSGQPWKNMDCQIVGASLVKDAQVHVQNIKSPMSLDSLGINVTKHPHYGEDEDYYNLVSGMSVNLCMSLSEVYSYFTAESFLLGTPVLTTPITPVLKDAPKTLQVCRNPHFEDPIEIARAIDRIMKKYDAIRDCGREYVLKWNERNFAVAKKIKDHWLTE